MNDLQRVVLVIAAFALTAVLVFTPFYRGANDHKWHLYWADSVGMLATGFVISLIAIALYLACRDRKK